MLQYLLDTNILLAWIRWSPLAQYLRAYYQLDTLTLSPIISVVSEAELRVLAGENNWGESKMRNLEKLINYLAPVPIPYKSNVAAYVALDIYSRQHGCKMGKNDLWIAATAMVEGATILTTDKDFDHLPQSMVKHVFVDPSSSL